MVSGDNDVSFGLSFDLMPDDCKVNLLFYILRFHNQIFNICDICKYVKHNLSYTNLQDVKDMVIC